MRPAFDEFTFTRIKKKVKRFLPWSRTSELAGFRIKGLDPEKVFENTDKNRVLEPRHPGKGEVPGFDPGEAGKLLLVSLKIDVRVSAVEVAEKIRLGLSAILSLLQFSIGKLVAVVGAAGDESIIILADSDFLFNFPVKSGD